MAECAIVAEAEMLLKNIISLVVIICELMSISISRVVPQNAQKRGENAILRDTKTSKNATPWA